MSTRPSRRRIKTKRSATLDPSTQIDNYYSLSLSPSPNPYKKKSKPTRKNRRIIKSKSPSPFHHKKAKKSRHRSTSYAPFKSDLDLSKFSLNLDTNSKTTKCKAKPRKCRKYTSQTPLNAANRKKKAKKWRSCMTPKISLSSSITESLFSSDDELYDNRCGIGTVQSHRKQPQTMQTQTQITKLSTSNTVQKASKLLNLTDTKLTNKINTNFQEFRRALNEQQCKLLGDLEAFYSEKKQQLISIEKILFSNAQKSKNRKQREFTFDSNVQFVIDEAQILSQIHKYGHIQTETISTNTKTATNRTELYAYGDVKSEDSALCSSDSAETETETMAMKQKLILGEIQCKTMNKLDVVIVMEREAQKKAKRAAALRREVDEGMRYIAERSKVINDKIAVAMRELEQAREAVAGNDPKDINEIKSLKSPPSVIENVITATVMILGHRIKEWRDVQKLLSYKFKPELLSFDTYSLSPIIRQEVYDKYVGNADFNYDRVYEGSKVCGNLVLWVISQINYSRLLDVIIPLQKEVRKLKKESMEKGKLAAELMQNVKELEDNIKLYTDQCNQMIDHIIKSTDYELKQFSDKLQPLNEKFNQLLSKNVLD